MIMTNCSAAASEMRDDRVWL